jgi:N-methylhydantoinase A
VPNSAGALSAIGVLTADVVKDQSRTIMLEVHRDIETHLGKAFTELERAATTALRGEGFPVVKQRHERSLAMRYKGQSFELEIKQTSGNIAASFHRAHRERYGYAQETNAVEVVSARVRSTGIVEKLRQQRRASPQRTLAKAAKTATAYLDEKKLNVAVYQRDTLATGAQLRTPCIVTEYSSTTLIPPGAQAEVDGFGNLIIQVA